MKFDFIEFYLMKGYIHKMAKNPMKLGCLICLMYLRSSPDFASIGLFFPDTLYQTCLSPHNSAMSIMIHPL